MPLKKFMMIFMPYLVIYIVYLIYEMTIANNVDVKGWWPLALIFTALYQALVSIVYCVIDKLSPSSYQYTAVYGLLFALPFAIIFLISEIFYPINWYAVSMEEVELTAAQAVVQSSLFLPVTIGMILLTHLIMRCLICLRSIR
ncbi:hypothetical protein ACFPZK_02600 [Psychrobacter urativorans]|uniref:hypothetical protein n=1 Tax=Psychrobacter urativorans TaxID=45610 RepID=UPI0019188906|nr:hypothetical protein [Psychrobacter urativorans]